MKVRVCYALPQRQTVINVDLPDGATLKEALERSGILRQFPEIDLETQKVGVYGKAAPLETVLDDGARVEIYRPITADPKTVKRRPAPEKAAS
ncbi:MAG: RnfH family protein [Rhodospirillales bacterium]|nr:RnfH family protein [Rhodospirillales bacterium]